MSSTCSQGSGDSATALNPSECAPPLSVKSIPSPEPCCVAIGLGRPSMKTSARSTGECLSEPSISSAAAIPASLSAWPDCSAARQTQDISGRKCIELYERSGLDGSLPRTLLDIFGSVSTRSPMRWKMRVSPSGRLLFQLAPSARRTAGIGSGLLPTPTASDSKGASDNCKRIKTGDVSYLRYFLHFYLKPSRTSWPHPCFVERMMGYPIGHTDLGRSATPSFRKSRRLSARRSFVTNNRGSGRRDE